MVKKTKQKQYLHLPSMAVLSIARTVSSAAVVERTISSMKTNMVEPIIAITKNWVRPMET